MLFRNKSRGKIPCYILVFEQVDIIRKTLDFLAGYADQLDLIVLENPSANTASIKKIIDSHGQAGTIKSYYLFKKNITGAVFDVVLNEQLGSLRKTPLVMLTDGDMTVEDVGWLDEELAIMEHHPEVFACGVSLDMSNLPLKSFPEAKDWIPPDKEEHDDYNEAVTGGHLLLLRGKELCGFIDWKNKHGLSFVDSVMHRYCFEELHKKWARTKRARAYHLTWDLYKDINHPYTRLKTGKTHQQTWYHGNTAPYDLTEY